MLKIEIKKILYFALLVGACLPYFKVSANVLYGGEAAITKDSALEGVEMRFGSALDKIITFEEYGDGVSLDGKLSLSGEITFYEDVVFGSGVIFNYSNLDKDFQILKDAAGGVAYKYNAGADTHTLSGAVHVDGVLYISDSIEINTNYDDVDFEIRKGTSGEMAYKYDSGNDEHTFSGNVSFTDEIVLSATGSFEGNVVLSGALQMAELASSPAATDGFGKVYVKNDEKLYYADGSGVEYDLTSGGGGSSKWTATEFLSRNSDSSIEVDGLVDIFKIGRPLRYKQDEVTDWRYGLVVGYSDGTVTIDGAPFLATYNTIEYGTADAAQQIVIYEPGNLSTGDNYSNPYTWQQGEAYIIRVTGELETAPTGSSDVEVMIGVGGTSNDLMTSALVLGDTSESDSGVAIDVSEYNVQFGEQIYVNIDDVGDTVPGAGLLLNLLIIRP